MLRSIPLLLGFLFLVLPGCKQYYDVQAACQPKEHVPGGSFLEPVPHAAFNRINCYRRLTGVAMATANELVQNEADGELRYVLANPNQQNLIGKLRENSWLTQQSDDPQFSGTNAYERLTNTDYGAGYVFFDLVGTETWEFMRVTVDDPILGPAPTGEAAVDYLMRDPTFRQVALQPSWVDGAYAEVALTPDWFTQGGWVPEEEGGSPLPTGGRAYYLISLHSAPHVEHADRPVFLPKEDQTDVPLYGLSENTLGTITSGTGRYPTVELSYPITFLVGALDPANYSSVDQNQYNAQLTAASIVGPEGALETHIVMPGDEPVDVWPAGYFLRSVLAVYSREPFAPSSDYTIYADMSHPEGDFEIQYDFHTRAEDPGVDPEIGRTVLPSATTRLAPPARTWSSHMPAGGLALAPPRTLLP